MSEYTNELWYFSDLDLHKKYQMLNKKFNIIINIIWRKLFCCNNIII